MPPKKIDRFLTWILGQRTNSLQSISESEKMLHFQASSSKNPHILTTAIQKGILHILVPSYAYSQLKDFHDQCDKKTRFENIATQGGQVFRKF